MSTSAGGPRWPAPGWSWPPQRGSAIWKPARSSPTPTGSGRGWSRAITFAAMLKCYTLLHLLRVLPQAMVATVVESLVALVTRRGYEAQAIVGAWTWNLRHLGDLRRFRAEVRRLRAVPDAEVRRLQARGSSRLTMYLQRRLNAEELARHFVEASHELAVSVGRGPARAATALLCLLTLGLLIGSRDLFTGRIPAIGQFAPFPRPSTLLTHFFDGWRTTGMGSAAPAPAGVRVAGNPRRGLPRTHGRPRQAAHPGRLAGGRPRRLAPGSAPGFHHAADRRGDRHPRRAAALQRPGPGPVGRSAGLRGHAVVPAPPRPHDRHRALRRRRHRARSAGPAATPVAAGASSSACCWRRSASWSQGPPFPSPSPA